MADSKLYGVELDDVSGRIARQLYQRSSVAIQGFEKAQFSDNFFDVAIGNVPFGQFKVSDRRYDRLNLPIHEYFIAKTLDKVRPGGVIAFVTSSYTMDKRTANTRKYIAQRAELLGAVRLPNNAFKAAAGTEVVSDILFLQKRDRMTLTGTTYTEKKEAGSALLTLCHNLLAPDVTPVGSYRGLTLELSFDSFTQEYRLSMKGRLRHMLDQFCKALYISAGQITVQIQGRDTALPHMELDDGPYQKTVRFNDMLQQMQKAACTPQEPEL